MKNGLKWLLFFAGAIFVILLDQFSKWLVLMNIPQDRTIPVISGMFDLVHVRNRGAAFGFLNRQDIEWQFWLFLGATAVALGAIFYLLKDTKKPSLAIGLGLILGGALGNLIDRVRYRSVVDFLDFYWHAWHWPAFNVADMAICFGAFLTCIALWQRGAKQ